MVAIGLIGFKPNSFHVVGIKGCGLKVFADPFAYVKRVDLILIALKGRLGCDPANAFFIQTSTTASLLNQAAARAMPIRGGKTMLFTFVPSCPDYSGWYISRRYVMMPNTKTSAIQVMNANAVKSSRKIVLLVDQLAV